MDVEEKYNLYKEINRLTELTTDQDERGLVLSMSAFAEDCLGRLLTAFLRATKTSTALINGSNAPLGTFSARIMACHAMGLISDEQFKDLECVRKIRNEFAHAWQECSLSDAKIKDWIGLMRPSRILSGNSPPDPRYKFQASGFSILIEMETLVDHIGKGKLKLKPRGFTLGPSTNTVKDEQDIPTTGADQK